MDKTPEYIKMSIEAEKIQEILKDKFDFRSQGYCVKHKCLLTEGYDGSVDCKVYHKWLSNKKELPTNKEYEEHRCLYIGLPYQDQLQEMVVVRGFSWLLITFFQFCQQQLKKHSWLTGRVDSPLDSLEKLWLAFVMKERYQKIWDNKESKWTHI